MNRSIRDRDFPNVYRPRAWYGSRFPYTKAFRKAFQVVREFFWLAAFAGMSFAVVSFVTHAALAAQRLPGNYLEVNCSAPEFRDAKQLDYIANYMAPSQNQLYTTVGTFPMRLEIGFFGNGAGDGTEGGSDSKLRARILSVTSYANRNSDSSNRTYGKATCQAVCEVKRFDRDAFTGNPLGMDLSCSSPSMRSLKTHAQVIWTYGPKQATFKTEIKFGNWLEGYEPSRLAVELDSYQKKPGKLAKAE